MTIHIRHGDLEPKSIDPDGNLCYTYTFTPTSADDELVLNTDEWANVDLEHIMLNKGSTPLPFEQNTVEKSQLAQMFDNLHEVSADFRNLKENLEGQIVANAKGFEAKYKEFLEHEDKRETSNRSEWEGLMKLTAKGLTTSFNQKVSDEAGKVLENAKSFTTQTADEYKSVLMKQIKEGDQEVLNALSRKAGSLESLISDLKAEQSSKLTQTVNSFTTKIEDLKEQQSSAIAQTQNLITSRVNDAKSGMETKIDQLSNSISWRVEQKVNNSMTGSKIISAINANTSGVQIKGENIALDGNVTMNNAFARKLFVEKLDAYDVKAFMGSFGHVVASNLDAKSITGFDTSFIQSIWNRINGFTYIDGAGVTVNQYNNNKMKLNQNGMHFTDNYGNEIGNIGASYMKDNPDKKGLSFQIPPNRYMSWSKKNDFVDDSYTIIMEVGVDRKRSVVIHGFLDVYQGLNLYGSHIDQAQKIMFINGTSYIDQSESWLNLHGDWGIKFYIRGSRAISFDSETTNMSTDLDLHNHTLSNYTESSDRRLKENIQFYELNALDLLNQVRYVSFDWKKDKKHAFGFIAQEVQAIFSDLITTTGNGYLGYDPNLYTHFIGMSVQQLYRKVMELQDEIKQLRNS
jgi:phage infection protein|nr:MAG TPA: tail protein [Caudoviricetes sp.]